MMMIRARSSFSRIARQTWSPLIFGRRRSHTIASGRFAKASSIPALPSSASITSQPCFVKRRAIFLRLSTSSSMSSTVGMACSAGFCQPRSGKQAFSGEGITPSRMSIQGAAVYKPPFIRSAVWRPPLLGLEQTGTEAARLPAFPPEIGMEIDFLRRNIEPDGAQQIRDALAAFHRFFQAAREELDVFLVGFERELALREMLGQRFVVVIDQLY